MEFIQVATSVADHTAAERMATALVERRLAACVQILGPVQSVYRWQGQIERSEEWQLFIKTTESRYEAVEALICELHAYECPEIIAMPITDASMKYLRWINDAVDPTG